MCALQLFWHRGLLAEGDIIGFAVENGQDYERDYLKNLILLSRRIGTLTAYSTRLCPCASPITYRPLKFWLAQLAAVYNAYTHSPYGR